MVYFTSWYAPILLVFSTFSSLMNKERQRNRASDCPVFSFCHHCHGSSWLIQGNKMSKKDMIELYGCLCVLLHSHLISAFKASSSLRRKLGFSRLSVPHSLNHRYFTPTLHLLWVLLNAHSLVHWYPVFMRYCDSCTTWMWLQKTVDSHIISLLPTCMFHFPISLHLKNTSSTTKLVNISRWQQQSIKLSMRLLGAWGPM